MWFVVIPNKNVYKYIVINVDYVLFVTFQMFCRGQFLFLSFFFSLFSRGHVFKITFSYFHIWGSNPRKYIKLKYTNSIMLITCIVYLLASKRDAIQRHSYCKIFLFQNRETHVFTECIYLIANIERSINLCLPFVWQMFLFFFYFR